MSKARYLLHGILIGANLVCIVAYHNLGSIANAAMALWLSGQAIHGLQDEGSE